MNVDPWSQTFQREFICLNAFAVGIVKELKMYNKAQHDIRIIRIAFIFFICDEIDFVFIKLYEIIYMIFWYLG